MSIKLSKHKLSAREKNRLRIRKTVKGTEDRPRLAVYRSATHIYAQLICDTTGRTLASASTLDKEVLKSLKDLPKKEDAHSESKSTKSTSAARAVGLVLAQRTKS